MFNKFAERRKMAKLKKSPAAEQAEMVQRNIYSVAALCGCRTNRDIAERIGLSHVTITNREKNPALWRLDELIRVSSAFGCSLEWLLTDHRKEKNDG